MKIYRSVKPNWLTQKFGENKLSLYKSLGLKGHNGVDWFLIRGNPVYWDCDLKGKVLLTQDDATAGVGCSIITEQDGKIYKHIFWHFLRRGLKVKVGDIVDTGDLLGFGDSTGMSTGDHLHRGLKEQKKDKYERYYTINRDNGYEGAINPMPFFKNIFVQDSSEYKMGIMVRILEKIKEIYLRRIAMMKEK